MFQRKKGDLLPMAGGSGRQNLAAAPIPKLPKVSYDTGQLTSRGDHRQHHADVDTQETSMREATATRPPNMVCDVRAMTR